MRRVLIKDLQKYINKEVLIYSWIEGIRKIGRLKFFIMRDRSGYIQGVSDKDIEIKKGTVAKIFGKVKEEKQAPKGIEIEIDKIETIDLPKEHLPFEYYRDLELLNLSLSTILDYRPLFLRNIKIGSIFKIKAAIVKYFRDFLRRHDFLEVHTPKIVISGTEGGTKLFKIEYFDKSAYLAQSPQFYKQMLVGAGFERVYEVGFVYRAEDHETKRHLNEYLSLDFEIGFIEDENDIIDLEIQFLKELFKYLRKNYSEILKDYEVDLEEIKDIPRIPFYEAREILNKEEVRHADDELLKLAESRYKEGEALYGLKRYGEAIKYYDWAIKINPKYDKAWYKKGLAFHKLKIYDKAIECYEKAIKINPNNAEAWNNKGLALCELKRYEEAIKSFDEVLKINPKYNDDLTPEEEKLLCDFALKKYGTNFIFITKFPIKIRPFYTMPDKSEIYSRGFDLLYKGMEITTGSQRIHDYSMLYENIKKFGLDPDNFGFYLEIFKYGMPPHGGLAIGAERLTCQILGLKNVREASFFPRDRYRLVP